jgi:hypothetical protein
MLQPSWARDFSEAERLGGPLSKWFYVLFAMLVVVGVAIPVIALCMDAFARRPPRD